MNIQVVKWRGAWVLAARMAGGAILVACVSAALARQAPQALPRQFTGTVTHIADGDTFTLRAATAMVRVRIAGIDAPERGQAYSQRARSALAAMLSGTTVDAACAKSDAYERQVCTVSADGRDAGLALVDAGLAWHFKRYAAEQPEDERQLYAAAEEAARIEQRGLWRERDPMPPWVCRERKRSGSACH